jgi:hypothetical protein
MNFDRKPGIDDTKSQLATGKPTFEPVRHPRADVRVRVVQELLEEHQVRRDQLRGKVYRPLPDGRRR